MLQNSSETKKYKVHTSFQKKNKDKKFSDYPILNFKIKIHASEGIVKYISKETGKKLPNIKPSVSSKPVKPRKAENKYLNTRISQDVALANEPVHGGIADSVKTRKRGCKDNVSSAYSPGCSFNQTPPLIMLSPKKRKAKKKNETSAPFKKWKSEASFNQKSYVQDNRKTVGTPNELNNTLNNINLQTTSCRPQLCNERYNRLREAAFREYYNEQLYSKRLGKRRKKFAPPLRKTFTPYKRAYRTRKTQTKTLDLSLPYEEIFKIERDILQLGNSKKSYDIDQVESTILDPIFKNVAKKFQESSEMVISEYLAEGYPDVEQIEKASFQPMLFKKIQHSPESFNQYASPENIFPSSNQELVIASYEDAVEVKIEAEAVCSSLESPPYGSQDSGYTSMTSPFSDDPDRLHATVRKSVNQANRPLPLTDVQFLKMCHSYSKHGCSKKWSTKKLVNNVSSKTSLHLGNIMSIPTPNKRYSQPSMNKIVSNECATREEQQRDFSPRGNEHAKALRDRRVVYLGNIPSTYTAQYLREKFKRFGEIENIQIKSKESDEFDIVDHRLLASQPLRGNGSNSRKGNVPKGSLMKHFGFVTFKKIAVAREVFDKRRELCTWAGGSINYGGRREFVREDYSDFDAEANNLNPGCSYKQNQENEVDYTQLLKKEQEKRGLIISPNSKRPQHSHHV